jgi:glycine hydroxymethyltransferase
MRETEMRHIAKWITDVLANREDAATLQRIRGAVLELCRHYPAPAEA